MADGTLLFKTALDESGITNGLSSVKSTASAAFGVAAKAITAVSGALTAGAGAGVLYNSTIENYTTSFEVMTGSADKANEVVEKLKELGSNTPYELAGLADCTRMLMGYGITADTAVEKMNMLGDISQGNAENMGSITKAYGQMSAAGIASMDDINMMIDAGFSPLLYVSKMTGESMVDLRKRVSEGKVSFDEIATAMEFATSEGQAYYQSSEKQAKTFSGQISTLKDNAQTLLGEVVQPISDSMVNTLLPSAVGSIEELSTAFKKDGVDGLISAAGTMIAEFVTAAAEQAPKMVDLAVKLLGSLIQGIIDNLPQLIQAAQKIATTILDGIGDLCPAISPVTDALGFLVENMDKVLAVVVPLAAAFVAWKMAMAIATLIGIVTSATSGLTIAQTLLNAVMLLNPFALIAALIAGLVAAFIYLWNTNEGFREAIMNIWNAIKDFFTVTIPEIVTNIIDWFKSLPENVKAAFDSFITKAQEFITGLWENLVNGVQNCVDNVKQFFDNLPHLIGYALGLLIKKIIEFGTNFWTWVTVDLPQIIAGIVNWFAELPGRIWDWLLQTATKVYLWGEDIKQKAKDAVTGFIENAITTITELPGKIWEWLLKTAVKVLEWKEDLTQKAKDAISSLVEKVTDTIKDLPEKIKEVGVNVAMGFYNGIKEKIDWIKEKVGGFFTGIADGVKDALGIHSPSRVFAEIGKFSAAGFDTGFDKYGLDKQITGNIKNSIGNIRANLQGISGSSGGNSTAYTQTNNFFDTQTSPDAITRKLRKNSTFGLAGAPV